MNITNAAYRSPDQVYSERLSVLHEALRQHKRLTRPEILILLKLKEGSARTFLNKAVRTGDLYREGKRGYFLNEHDYHDYDVSQAQEKRRKKSLQEKKWRERRKLRVLSEVDNNPSSVNTIFDECRKYWSGYRWHKVFGSGARA